MPKPALSEKHICSSLQKTMLMATMRADSPHDYTIQIILKLFDALDPTAFKNAFFKTLNNNPILLSSFRLKNNGEFQTQQCHTEQVEWKDLDFSEANIKLQSKRLSELLIADRQNAFNLHNTSTPLLRCHLIKRSTGSFTFIWTLHHALIDGNCIVPVLNQLFQYYQHKQEIDLTSNLEVKPDFFTFSKWLQQNDWNVNATFWKKHLKDFTKPTPIPEFPSIYKEHKQEQDPAGSIIRRPIEASLSETLRKIGRTSNLSFHTFAIGAWLLLLSRYSLEQKVTIGVVRSGRKSSPMDTRNIIGPVISILPFSVEIDDKQTTISWLKKIRQEWRSLNHLDHTPIEKIYDYATISKGQPIFHSLFSFELTTLEEKLKSLDNFWPKFKARVLQRPNLPITIVAHQAPAQKISIVYDEKQLSKSTANTIADHIITTLEAFARDYNNPLGEIKLFSTPEKQIHAVPSIASPKYNNLNSILQPFEVIAEKKPEKTAILCKEKRYTYNEINHNANKVAGFLSTQAIGPEDIVALLFPACPEALIAAYGVIKCGGAFFFINPQFPTDRKLQLIKNAKAKILIFASDINKPSLEIDSYRWDEIKEHRPIEKNTVKYSANHLACLVHTSGSTGLPKCAMIEHSSLLNYLQGYTSITKINANDIKFFMATVGTDSFVSEILTLPSVGGTLVFREETYAPSLNEFLTIIEKESITIASLPSSYWHEWVIAIEQSKTADIPPSLCMVITGMEKVQPELFNIWQKVIGDKVRWINAYGPTETTCIATIYEGRTHANKTLTRVPIGRPLPNTSIHVLDKKLRPLPQGCVGEIHIGGKGVCRGYLDDSEITNKLFIPDPFETKNVSSRIYATGDLGFFLPDGNLVFIGRKDNQVKIRGHRIELEEIETTITAFPGIESAAVTTRETTNHTELVSFATGIEEKEKQNLQQYLKQKLPPYMIPSETIILQHLPRLPNGKINRKKIKQLASTNRIIISDTDKTPSDEMEAQFLQIWRNLLENPGLTIYDNFFASGGDSLLAVRLFAEIKRSTGYESPMSLLLSNPNIKNLVKAIKNHNKSNDTISLVTITDTPTNTNKNILILIPPFGGTSISYRELAEKLEKYYISFGLELDPTIFKHTEQGLMNAYLYKLKTIFDQKQFSSITFAGYSTGGLIALELGKYLAKLGIDIKELLLFDPPIKQMHSQFNSRNKQSSFFSDKGRLLFKMRKQLVLSQTLDFRQKFEFANRLITRKIKWWIQGNVSETQEDQSNANQNFAINFRLSPSNLPILLFKTIKFDPQKNNDYEMAWKQSNSHLIIHDIPGDHTDILQEPVLSLIANNIKEPRHSI